MNSINLNWTWPETPGQSLVLEDQWEKVSALLKLSKREQEVCRLLMDGNTRTSIASELGIKSRTVRQYLEQLHVKLKVNNRVGLVLRVIQIRDSLLKNDGQKADSLHMPAVRKTSSVESLVRGEHLTPTTQLNPQSQSDGKLA